MRMLNIKNRFIKKITAFISSAIFILIIFATLFITGCSPANQSGTEVRSETNTGQSEVDIDKSEAGEVFSFIFMSDTQADPELGDYSLFGEILGLALIHESRPTLLVLGGDNVNNGSREEEWVAFWAAITENPDGIIMASAAGNHDNDPLLAKQFDYPQTAPENNSNGYFYSFTAGNIFFLILDSNILGAGRDYDIEWTKSQLTSDAAINADWRITVLHHPLWTVADIPRDMQRAETMRESLLYILDENGVDLILCGHQHMYSRSIPMRGGTSGNNGLIQIMAASGAKESYRTGNNDNFEVIAPAPNYLIIEAWTEALEITAYDGNGETLDNVRILRRR